MSTAGDDKKSGAGAAGSTSKPEATTESGETKTEEPASAWGEKRPKYKKRITLELSGPMLSLPGERSPGPHSESPPSSVFMVPEEFRARAIAGPGAPPRESPEGPPSPAPVPTKDAWGRADLGAARARSRSSTPPPAPIFDTADSNDALAMVGGTRRENEPQGVDFRREMQERFELGDFSGALRAAELVLGQEPHHARATMMADECREKLAGLYLARLGGGQRAIERAVAPTDVRWLGIDHRAGFMLSQIQGDTSIEELVDISGLPRHDALKILVELVGAGAVRIK